VVKSRQFQHHIWVMENNPTTSMGGQMRQKMMKISALPNSSVKKPILASSIYFRLYFTSLAVKKSERDELSKNKILEIDDDVTNP